MCVCVCLCVCVYALCVCALLTYIQQEWTLSNIGPGMVLEYPTRYTKFQGVSSLTIHFPRNFRDSGTLSLHFIGLKGESTQNRREPIGTFVYEALPSAKDHKTVAEDGTPSMLM